MAVYHMPSSKDNTQGFNALADVLNAFGRYERERQDMQMRDAILKKASDPNAKWEDIVKTVSGFQPEYSKNGVQGAMQRFGGMFAGPSQTKKDFSDVAMAQMTPEAVLDRQAKQADIDSTTGDWGKMQQAMSMASQLSKMAEQEELYGDAATAAGYRKSASHWTQVADKLGGGMFGQGQPQTTKRIETTNLNDGTVKVNGEPIGKTPVPQQGSPAQQAQPTAQPQTAPPQVAVPSPNPQAVAAPKLSDYSTAGPADPQDIGNLSRFFPAHQASQEKADLAARESAMAADINARAGARQVQQATIPELSDIWSDLNDEERQVALKHVGSAAGADRKARIRTIRARITEGK